MARLTTEPRRVAATRVPCRHPACHSVLGPQGRGGNGHLSAVGREARYAVLLRIFAAAVLDALLTDEP